MKKILVSFNSETINFKYKIDKTKSERDLSKTIMNTNVISNDELLFSDSYLKNNINIMVSFLNEIIKERKISKIVIEDFDIVPLILDITNNIKSLTKLYIIPDTTINYKIFEKLKSSKYIKYVSCFEIPSFMLEKLCDMGIIVDLRCEIVSISNFVHQNNLVNYTKLYYRKTIKIFNKFNSDDLNDFETFCQINRNLKTIYLYDFDINMVNNIYSILEKTNKRNIKILLCENLNNASLINNNIKELKFLNKKLLKNCDSKMKIIYSIDYISKNFLKQVSLVNLKTCLVGIVALELIIFLSIKVNNLKTDKNIQEINEIASDLSISSDDNNVIITEEENNDYSVESNEPITSYTTKYEESFDKLSNINSDVKAWLKVNNTSINYPIVQYSDNDYYLSHDFNKDTNANGWIFIDYRNHLDNLDQNTIIYGHNSKGSIMFATLKTTLKEYWYNNSNNLDITFNTPNANIKARIFSIYVIDNTNDYLYTNFYDDSYQNFIDLIKGRSIHDFGVPFTTEDKMITLSTCSGNNKRLVVHAKIL